MAPKAQPGAADFDAPVSVLSLRRAVRPQSPKDAAPRGKNFK
jgi:hypothetical protein